MIENGHDGDKLLIYGKYYQLIENIKYLQSEQTAIRFEVSRILLGTFAVIGVLYFAGVHLNHFHPMKVCIVVPWLAMLLIYTRIDEDLIVKERLRIASFSKALKLEKENSWLPKFHTRMFDKAEKEHHGSGHRKVKYYLGCLAILMSLSGVSLGLSSVINGWLLVCALIAYIAFYVVCYRYVVKWVGKTSTMISRLSD